MPATDRRATIRQGGRDKAFRPIPEADRRAAIEDGLAAYDRGDFFLAHELLEPAWMGTADLAERELLQGLIKLAAAYVHDARSNAAGIRKNLSGARERVAAGRDAATSVGIDADALVPAIDARLSAGVSVGDPPIGIDRITRAP